MNNCTVFAGVIESIDIDQEKREAHTRFRVGERLGANADRSRDETEIEIGWSSKGDDTFFDVRLEPGTHLMLGKRPNVGYIDFALGNDKYFSSVRSTVLFHDNNDLRGSFASVLGPLKDQSDDVFAGYVSENFWRLASIGNLDEHLAVLKTLLIDSNFPSQGSWPIGEGIFSILRRESARPSIESRDEAIRKLIELSSSADKDKAITSIRVLTSISEKEWFQPKRYLERSEAQKLIQNIHKIKGIATDSLEQKLSKVN